ncbi:MAG TPA: AsmA family protein, partial [Prolixibacteraceae bacterium]|nr:AsmA family protein [Prolixibacteraceae bacterium]
MKKALIIIGIVVAVLVAALIAVPIFFKDTVLEKTKTAINKNINAEVEFGDIKLSLFRNFPKVTVVLEDAVVTVKGDFRNDTLLDVNSIGLKMSLLSLIGNSEKSIEEVELLNPKLNLIVNSQGSANWDITKPQSEAESETSPEELNMQLEEIILKNGQIIYDDRQAKTRLNFNEVNLNIEGEMYGTSAKLQANGGIDRFSLNYDGSNFIDNISLKTETLLDINYETMAIEILENELLVNRLPLTVEGTINVPGDSILFDLDLKAKESGFENFLALVPPDFEHYLEGINATGNAGLAGTLKGIYYEESYPALNLNLDVSNGNLHYSDLPEEINNIRAKATISKPQGSWDLTVIEIKDAHAQIRNNPVDMSLTLKNLVSDPWFDGTFVGKINLEHLKGALPLDSVNMSGLVDANLFVNGNYSAIEKEQYDKIKADGVVMLSDYSFQSADLTQPILVPGGKLDFSPASINLSEFDMRIGQSDFKLTGKLSNYLNYYFSGGDLRGTLQLNSSQVNLNELFRLQANQNDTLNTEEEQQLAFDVPQNINLTFRSSIQSAVFDRLPIKNINGLITAENGKLVLNNLNMFMLDGQLSLTGSYQNTKTNQPLFDFGLDISNFDIPLAYNTLTSV